MSGAVNIYEHLHVLTKANMARERLDGFTDRVQAGEWLAALRHAEAFAAIYTDIIADVVQEAYNEGATKKAIADALNIAPATLRGLERLP